MLAQLDVAPAPVKTVFETQPRVQSTDRWLRVASYLLASLLVGTLAWQLAHEAAREILDVRLHRGEPDSNGPVIELLGEDLQGSVANRNAHVDDLLQGRLYLVVYTRDAPIGAIRGQIARH